MPPLVASEKLTGFMMSGSDSTHSEGANAAQRRCGSSKRRFVQFEDVFAAQFPVSRLKAAVTKLGDGYERVDDELLAYLRRCLTSVKGPVMQPEIPVFLNDLLSMEDFRGGDRANDGDRHLRTLSVDAFHARRIPRSLGAGHRALRVSLEHARDLDGPSEAQGIIAKIGQKWKFQQRGLKDQVFKSSGGGH